jgi:hypothetical protein
MHYIYMADLDFLPLFFFFFLIIFVSSYIFKSIVVICIYRDLKALEIIWHYDIVGLNCVLSKIAKNISFGT